MQIPLCYIIFGSETINTEIMENLLLEYLSGKKQTLKESVLHPVITINRTHGCNSDFLTNMLVNKLNECGTVPNSKKWTLINREVIENTANELHVSTDKVRELTTSTNKSIIQDVLMAFTNEICSSKTKNTIQDVVNTFAQKGNLVLVGRAGFSLLQHHQKALHIKFMAPLDWRIQNVQEKYQVSLSEAKERVEDVDSKRKQFNANFSKNQSDEEVYDLIFNCMKLSPEVIVDSIINVLKLKKMI